MIQEISLIISLAPPTPLLNLGFNLETAQIENISFSQDQIKTGNLLQGKKFRKPSFRTVPKGFLRPSISKKMHCSKSATVNLLSPPAGRRRCYLLSGWAEAQSCSRHLTAGEERQGRQLSSADLCLQYLGSPEMGTYCGLHQDVLSKPYVLRWDFGNHWIVGV